MDEEFEKIAELLAPPDKIDINRRGGNGKSAASRAHIANVMKVARWRSSLTVHRSEENPRLALRRFDGDGGGGC